MREVLYRNLTSAANRKKDIFLREVFEKNGVVAKTERRCLYFIKDVKRLENKNDFQKWLDVQNGGVDKKKHFYVFKEHNDCLGEDKLVCKIAGTFYAMADRCLYTIAFLHSFKVTFMKVSLP
ncbi:MAG: hypothetical protein WC779_01405 [Candidatus Omnitrophota bacterium]|jgi:hypothetical protein